MNDNPLYALEQLMLSVDSSGHKHKGAGVGGGQFTSTTKDDTWNTGYSGKLRDMTNGKLLKEHKIFLS